MPPLSRGNAVPFSAARVAIVHDWLVNAGGGELVLDAMLKVFPHAQVFSLIDKRAEVGAGGRAAHVRTSWMQHVPGITRRYRSFLPLMPLAMRSLNVSEFDIVLCNSHAIAKGVTTHDGQLHLCYCLSPMRYAWDLRDQYLRESGLDRGLRGILARAMLERMRRWDEQNTPRVRAFATLSHFIADRIERAYHRSAEIIYPPVDTDYFTPAEPAERGDGAYLTASRFVPYKRLDMISRAFALLPDRKLVIVGDGPDAAKVRAASGSNVLLAGRESRERVRERLRAARAFVFAAEEDFGIAPVEAQACGTPVIAFGRGGVTETVRGLDAPEPTGVFYDEQTPESLADAIRRFEALERPISPAACRANALRFRAELFRDGLRAFVSREWERFRAP
jgi:glycosyltransferase involved in cell wall biosynthesis